MPEMDSAAAVNEAFRRLRAGDAAGALEAAAPVASAHPSNARAQLACGIAARMLGRLDEALAALERAARLDTRDHAAAYEAGIVHQMAGRLDAAVAQFERAARLRPEFFAAHFAAGLACATRGQADAALRHYAAAAAASPRDAEAQLVVANALVDLGRHDAAEPAFVRALAAGPDHFPTLKRFGQYSVARGNLQRAAKLFTEAARHNPDDTALPIFVAQVQLSLGNWDAAWKAYAGRPPRRHLERMLAGGDGYRVRRPAELAGRTVTLIAEQGYGDILFFLRWAAALRDAGAHLGFAGPVELHGLLARTGLFESFSTADRIDAASVPLLLGDLPQAAGGDPLAVPSLAIAPLAQRLAYWGQELEAAGPAPWIGVTWRAGTPAEELAHGLFKEVPVEALFKALAGTGGTVVALQRAPAAGEIDAASRALGRQVHDFSRANADLEDALALVALLDRHIGVSNTNMHLAAAAGRTADVLVPFPPEWRWRIAGDSPWFPGFRVLRQGIERDWTPVLARLGA